jgi:hypothetical protein
MPDWTALGPRCVLPHHRAHQSFPFSNEAEFIYKLTVAQIVTKFPIFYDVRQENWTKPWWLWLAYDKQAYPVRIPPGTQNSVACTITTITWTSLYFKIQPGPLDMISRLTVAKAVNGEGISHHPTLSSGDLMVVKRGTTACVYITYRAWKTIRK